MSVCLDNCLDRCQYIIPPTLPRFPVLALCRLAATLQPQTRPLSIPIDIDEVSKMACIKADSAHAKTDIG